MISISTENVCEASLTSNTSSTDQLMLMTRGSLLDGPDGGLKTPPLVAEYTSQHTMKNIVRNVKRNKNSIQK